MDKTSRAKLRGRIIEKFGTIQNFANHTSRGHQFVGNVLNDRAVMNQRDMEEWIDRLEIEPEEIYPYFFAH